jgi:hypothetical protein
MTYQHSGVTTPAPRLYEVTFEDGQTWRGTKRQFLLEHPDWYTYAVPVEQQVTSDVLPDFADDPRPKTASSSRRYYLPDLRGGTQVEHRPPLVGTTIKPRSSAQAAAPTTHAPARPQRRIHWLAIAGLSGMVVLVLFVGGSWVHTKWLATMDDWTYTQTFRTFSIDFAVGHNGDSATHPSHFIVQNDKRRIVILEFPADEPGKCIVYYGPVLLGDGQEKTPVTLSFQTDPQTGRMDMVLHVEDQQYLFTNNGTKFVAPAV